MTVAGCASPAPEAPATQNRLTGVVTRIVDGDTIDVETSDGGFRVRLAGVNAPEEEECFGDVAGATLEDMLADEMVVLETLGTDRFGRVLAHVSSDGRGIDLELVRKGLAIATSVDTDDPRRPDLLEAEDDAYSDGLGLWAANACGDGEHHLLAFDIAASVPDPDGPDEDYLAEERVVIVNDGDAAVSLAGWTLRDESSVHRYVFAPGAVVGPKTSLAVSSAEPGWDPGGGPVWNNAGDVALLQDGMGNVIARWRY